jgi:sulfate/thiosulfate transport system substrate-binding protein
MPRITRPLLALALLALAAAAAACGGKSDDEGGSSRLSLVAYSTPKEAYDELIPAFKRTSQGDGVSFRQSYGASGEQSRAVQQGLSADVVALSLEPDVTKLVKKGLVAENWNQNRYRGNVTNSVVVFIVRKGNPKNIRTWEDLSRGGIEVLNPNPFTSGGARWNVMAAYGSQIEQGRSPQQAEDYLKRLFKNIKVQDKSARESLQTFTAGKGDVLIGYENEAITAQRKGQNIDYVIPPQTILIENPAAVVTRSKNKQKAQAFLDYLRTPPAQRIYASKGYRPVVDSEVDPTKFPRPAGLFTIRDLGGWSDVTKKFFDPQNSVMARIERSLGVSTSG